MRDPLPFLGTDTLLAIIVIGLVLLWFVLRRTPKGVRIFLWVLGMIFMTAMVHNALWGACGRWGPWQTGTLEERRALQNFCTEPVERSF
ncbi:MAG TPA: hypothetical protein VGX03_17580 [Candidatus Binatia bacterium]|jgi:hypothetical protein|nr:hypothetical protein [Candidatus Binatia bacterium]